MNYDYDKSCPRCNEEKRVVHLHINRHGDLETHTYLCVACGMIFELTDPQEWIDKFDRAMRFEGFPKEKEQ